MAADDDPKLLATLSTMLRRAGYTVYAAYNGWIAHQLATRTAELDLLITNTRLTDLGATELIRQVRAVRPQLAVLHVGDPLPSDPDLRSIPSIREPLTAEVLLSAVERALKEPEGHPHTS